MSNNSAVLSELIIEGMDEEQIWQQLELQNSAQTSRNDVKGISRLLAVTDEKLSIKFDDEVVDDSEPSGDEDDDESSEVDEEETNEMESTKPKKSGKEYRKTVVDDEFFKLNEMAAFLDAEDKKAMNGDKKKEQSDEEDIDYFKEGSDDEDDEDDEDDAAQLKYKDYFVKKDIDLFGGKKVRKQSNFEGESEDDEDEDDDEDAEERNGDDNYEDEEKNKEELQNGDTSSDDDEDGKIKSTFEMENDMLRERIDKMEKQAIEEKSWQLKGEIQAQTRPKNSLLEEVLDFDMTRRPAPIITEETTLSLEEIIKNRIKNKVWDDVTRKIREENNPGEFRKKLILDQEKSKESLAQIYEKDFLSKVDGSKNGNQPSDEKEPEAHIQIRKDMRALFHKLDALANFHYTPKLVAPEAKIVTNIPTISMEEVAPTTFSSATHLAPEEVLNVKSTHLIGKSEMTKTDKTRQRLQKKNKHKLFRELNAKAGIQEPSKTEKSKSGPTDKSLKSSTAFFNELQNTETLRKTNKTAGNKSTLKEQLTFKQLKL